MSESISLNEGGRPFQTSGPQTKNARLPNRVLVQQTKMDLDVDVRS